MACLPSLVPTDRLAEFVDAGYVHLLGCVDSTLTNRALRAILAELGRGLSEEDAAAMQVNAKSFGSPALLHGAALRSLFMDSGIWALVCSIYGAHCAALPEYFVQVALRFPQEGDELDFKPWHIDNVTPEIVRPFGLLVGVFLSASASENSGNLTVYPGGHARLASLFRERGTRAVHRSVTGRIVTPAVDLAAPVQLLTGAGDVVVMHPLLPHRVAPNLSPHIRSAVYFRIYHSALPYEHSALCALRTTSLTRLWALGWGGLRAVLESDEICDADPYDLCDCASPVIPTAPLSFARDAVSTDAESALLSACSPRSPSDSGALLGEATLFWVRTSFCSADFEYWRRARRFIADEVPLHAGAVLDIGCASGLLLRCLRDWSGVPFTPFGFDVHWVVRLAPRLFSAELGARFVRCSLDAFLACPGSRCGLGERAYAMIFWNVWDNCDLDDATLASIHALHRLLAPAGKLVLGFYATPERNASRIAKLAAAWQGRAACDSCPLRVVSSGDGFPHQLAILSAH
jgi:SAM-dependent methyltransferase